jgi:hypothetical protein
VSATAGPANIQATAAATSLFIITLPVDVRLTLAAFSLEPIGQDQYIAMVRQARAVTPPCAPEE